MQNGCSDELQESLTDPLPGSVVNPHQQLLIILSNIGYCKDELSHELYYKYRNIWLTRYGVSILALLYSRANILYLL